MFVPKRINLYGTATAITLNYMEIVFIKSAMRNKVSTETLHLLHSDSRLIIFSKHRDSFFPQDAFLLCHITQIKKFNLNYWVMHTDATDPLTYTVTAFKFFVLQTT
jgi:hypothetical protein